MSVKYLQFYFVLIFNEKTQLVYNKCRYTECIIPRIWRFYNYLQITLKISNSRDINTLRTHYTYRRKTMRYIKLEIKLINLNKTILYDSDIVNKTRCYELQTKTSDLKLLY